MRGGGSETAVGEGGSDESRARFGAGDDSSLGRFVGFAFVAFPSLRERVAVASADASAIVTGVNIITVVTATLLPPVRCGAVRSADTKINAEATKHLEIHITTAEIAR